jgi:hypothetical protein
MKTHIGIVKALTRSLFITATILGCSTTVHAEDLRWLGLKLARGIAEPKEIAKPAEFSYTKPADKAATAVVNAGIYGVVGVPIGDGQEVEFGISLHKNTAISKRQDVVLAGVGLRGEISSWLQQQASVRSENDRLNQTRGINASYKLYPYIAKQLNSSKDLGNGLYVTPLVGIGIDYERISAVSDTARLSANAIGTSPTGSTVRATGEFGLAFSIGKLKVGSNYTVWRSQKQDGPFSKADKSAEIKSFSLGWQISPDITLAIDRVSGSNPVEGLINEKYTQITLKLNPSFF